MGSQAQKVFSGVGTGCEALNVSMKQPVFGMVELSMKRPTEKKDVFLQWWFFTER